jgi:hypothetical protein
MKDIIIGKEEEEIKIIIKHFIYYFVFIKLINNYKLNVLYINQFLFNFIYFLNINYLY